MDQEASRGREPQSTHVPGEKPSSAETIVADKPFQDGKVHEFNEQTNYVPKKTIITVRIPPQGLPLGRTD